MVVCTLCIIDGRSSHLRATQNVVSLLGYVISTGRPLFGKNFDEPKEHSQVGD